MQDFCINRGNIWEYKKGAMPLWRRKEQPQEDISDWLKAFMPVYEKGRPVVDEISNIEPVMNSVDKMNEVIATLTEGCMKLPEILEVAKKLPEPKHKESRKLLRDYVDALKSSLSACQCGVEWARKSTKGNYSKIIFWSSMTKELMEDAQKRAGTLSD